MTDDDEAMVYEAAALARVDVLDDRAVGVFPPELFDDARQVNGEGRVDWDDIADAVIAAGWVRQCPGCDTRDKGPAHPVVPRPGYDQPCSSREGNA